MPAKKNQAVLDMVAAINKSDVAWFKNIHPKSSEKQQMEAFDNIECQTIERYNNNYIKSNGDK